MDHKDQTYIFFINELIRYNILIERVSKNLMKSPKGLQAANVQPSGKSEAAGPVEESS